MQNRRNFIATIAGGIAGAAIVPAVVSSALDAPAVQGLKGMVGKYIPWRISALHHFAGHLSVWDMQTGETIEHVVAVDAELGLCKKFQTMQRPKMVYVNDGRFSDVFRGAMQLVPHPTETIECAVVDEDGEIVYEYITGTFEINWKDRIVPACIEELQEHMDPEMWRGMTENEHFDIYKV
jgi:hypothetical protein